MLGDSLRMIAGTASSIIGAVILISIILPWFLIAVFVILVYICTLRLSIAPVL